MSLFDEQLSVPTQAFATDSDSAARLAATQRMFERLGLMKPGSGGSPVPAASAKILDSYSLPKNVFAAQQGRPYYQDPSVPMLQALPLPENPFYGDAGSDLKMPTAARGRAKDQNIEDILRRAGAIIDNYGDGIKPDLSGVGPDGKPKVARAMTPFEGPDTGAINPNAGPAAVNSRAFVQKYLPYAKQIEQETGIPAHFLLGQMLAETGGSDAHAPQNNFGGIHAYSGYDGPTQRVMMSDGTYHTLQAYKTPLEGMRAQANVYAQKNMNGANERGISDMERARRLDRGNYGGSIGKGYVDLLMDRIKAAKLMMTDEVPGAARGGYFRRG